MLSLPGKALRLTEGGVGWLGVPANIGLLLKAPTDKPLQEIAVEKAIAGRQGGQQRREGRHMQAGLGDGTTYGGSKTGAQQM